MSPGRQAAVWLLLTMLTAATSRESCKISTSHSEMKCTNITSHFLPTEMFWSFDEDVDGFNAEVQRLEITDSNITTLQEQSFKFMTHLLQIALPGNSIQDMERGAFEGLVRLKWVDLSFNNLKVIPLEAFMNTRLSHMKLEGNTELEMPTNGPLLKAERLSWLSLRNCSIQHLSGTAFQMNPKLVHLDLSSNRLEMLPEHLFVPIQHLVYLDLSDNLFQTLDMAVFQSVPSFPFYPRSVILAGNRWECSCKLSQLIKWGSESVKEGKESAGSWAQQPRDSRLRRAVQCSEPQDMRGKPWIELRDLVISC